MNTGQFAWDALTVDPNLSQSAHFSEQEEWDRYFRRQNLLGEIVAGKMHPDDLLDCLQDDGRNVDAYIDGIEWSLQPLL